MHNCLKIKLLEWLSDAELKPVVKSKTPIYCKDLHRSLLFPRSLRQTALSWKEACCPHMSPLRQYFKDDTQFRCQLRPLSLHYMPSFLSAGWFQRRGRFFQTYRCICFTVTCAHQGRREAVMRRKGREEKKHTTRRIFAAFTSSSNLVSQDDGGEGSQVTEEPL